MSASPTLYQLPENVTQEFIVPDTQKILIEKSGTYVVKLTKPQAHADIVGTFLTTEKQFIDIEIFIVHQAKQTTAQSTFKGVAKDDSRIRFQGRIIIEPGCPHTQSFLEQRILLLSANAKAEAVPELEILSDDVKCSHAASISRIPALHLFYLQSRGLSPATAEKLIIDGFLAVS
jgi:Fe-S cluster assembly protein SufD